MQAKSGGNLDLLKLPAIPVELIAAWNLFISIKNADGEISLASIESYKNLMQIEIAPDDVRLLLKLEQEYRAASNG